MPSYWFVDDATGNIKRVVACREEFVEDQLQLGERYHKTTQALDRTQYYRVTKEGKVKERVGERQKRQDKLDLRNQRLVDGKAKLDQAKVTLSLLERNPTTTIIELELIKILKDILN